MKEETAQRIAMALERIAEVMEVKAPKKATPYAAQVQSYLKALHLHADELKGRMAMREITFAIGVEVSRPQYRAFGEALREYGAVKGASGPLRYYVFPG